MDRILWTDEFSNFISTKFNTEKRFGLEGCESLIPGLKSAVDQCVAGGADKATIGMPHRGRLSLLAQRLQTSHDGTKLYYRNFSGADALTYRVFHRHHA